MNPNFEITSQGTYIIAIATGAVRDHDGYQELGRIIAMCQSRDIYKVLIDGRQLDPLPLATEKLLYSIDMAQRYAAHIAAGGKPLHCATVLPTTALTRFRPGLAEVREQGMQYDLFTSIDKALAFLGVASDQD